MSASQHPVARTPEQGTGRRDGRDGRATRRLRLVAPPAQDEEEVDEQPALGDEAGTTTAEYTVVTGAAVAFGALLFKLLTSDWGNRILSTAFKHVISLLGA